MTIFAGLQGYRNMKRYRLSPTLFFQWLKAKWVADLKTLAWCIIMSPLLFVWTAGVCIVVAGELISMVGQLVIATKNIMPRWIFLPKNLREKQLQIANQSRKTPHL